MGCCGNPHATVVGIVGKGKEMSVRTVFDYPVSGTLNGQVNPSILKQELEESDSPDLTVGVESVVVEGTTIIITLTGNATEDDETVVNTVVAAHVGVSFVPVPARTSDDAETDDTADPGTEIEKVSLSVGPLDAGLYLLEWYMETRLASDSATSWVKARARVNVNGSLNERASSFQRTQKTESPFAGALPLQIASGKTITLALSFEQTGAVDNTAYARRARVSVVKMR